MEWKPELGWRLRGYWTRRLARYLSRTLAQYLGYEQIPGWAADWMGVELSSVGRAWTRSVIAQSEPSQEPRYRLMRAACLASLNPDSNRPLLDEALSAYPKEEEPLWPALARHIAHCSTMEDQLLLIDLAKHPEKRDEPLLSGLKYYVRGDLVFDDGSEMTLDALCQQLGLQALKYLDGATPREGSEDDE
jgi:hypothetical protein